MKVTVERAQLLKSLSHVHRVVERRNTIPILGNVLVRAETAKLSLKATDLDLEVTETLAAETGTGGSTTVQVKVWPQGTAEPTGWSAQMTNDTTAELQGTGQMAVTTYVSGSATNGPIGIAFDHLSVVAPN